jgi:hypothetical protein
MKLSKKDMKSSSEVGLIDSDSGPKFPFGLEIRLDDNSMDKLDMDMPAVGDKMLIVAVGEVTSTRQNDTQRGGKNRSVEIQIQRMDMGSMDDDSDDDDSESMVDALDEAIKDL